ncbi:MAG: 5-formyltetrahydrofolate cyclo-ligase [Ruminococcaceae bacterium]|nr:5-formyltetrahydrofolate cyclo-ligase [Oscillospiraceae bacterium]
MCTMTKQDLRKEFLARRARIDAKNHREWSGHMAEEVLSYVAKQKITTVMLYASFRSEPETFGLIQALLDKGLRVALPKSDAEGHMEGYVVTDVAKLVPGAFGILEPDGKIELPAEEQELIIVPGCVFGIDGSRIGYGRGYYDRYLAKCPKAIKAGFCFSLSLLESVPTDDFDMKMDFFFTENGVVNKV